MNLLKYEALDNQHNKHLIRQKMTEFVINEVG